ncbi:MAG: PRC-barrel domain-containing protein [Patescibacteria group bacterium]
MSKRNFAIALGVILCATAAVAQVTSPPKFVAAQSADQVLASKFKGTDVIGTDDKKLGDVSDILFDREGNIKAYVVGVGGFLGIGSKTIALSPNAFQWVPGRDKNDSERLRLSMTKDQLKEAAEFQPYKVPKSAPVVGHK